jgi:hypothetical protein
MLSLLNKDAIEMEPCKIRGATQPLVSRTGLEGKEISPFRSRDKNVLDFSSPKTLSSMNLRDLESKFGGSFSE